MIDRADDPTTVDAYGVPVVNPEIAIVRPPLSLYTELAATNNGRLLAILDERPNSADAVLSLMASLERFAWRGTHRLSDVGIRDGRGTVNLKGYAEFRATIYADRSIDGAENVQLRADDEIDPVVSRNARLSQVTHCAGVIPAVIALCTAIEEYALRKSCHAKEIGVPPGGMRMVPGATGDRELQALLARSRR